MDPQSSRKRKHEDEEMNTYTGYIQAISPIKTSKRNFRYFNGILQNDKDDYKEMVVFNDKVHPSFLQAEKQKSPVKLMNCTVLPNRTNESQMDLKFGSCSKLTYMDRLGFQFKSFKEQPAVEEKPVTDKLIEEVMCIELNTKINIMAKVTCLLLEKECLLYGDMKTMRKMLICDATGCVPMVLWEALRDQASVGDTFHFSDVIVKEYGSERYLTTSPTTKIKKVQDMACTVDANKMMPHTTGSIQTVQVTKTHLCSHCHVCIEQLPTSMTYKCAACNMRQKSSTVPTRILSKFCLKCPETGKLVNLTAEGTTLSEFIRDLKCDTDTDSIEEAMLSCELVKVTYQNKQALKIEILA